MSKKKFWGGYNNGFLDREYLYPFEGSEECFEMPAIFIRKKDAQKRYQDVRPIKFVEFKETKWKQNTK